MGGYDEGSGRYTVELRGGEVLRIKGANLEPAAPPPQQPPAPSSGLQAALAAAPPAHAFFRTGGATGTSAAAGEGRAPAEALEEEYGSDYSFKSYDSRQDDRPWH